MKIERQKGSNTVKLTLTEKYFENKVLNIAGYRGTDFSYFIGKNPKGVVLKYKFGTSRQGYNWYGSKIPKDLKLTRQNLMNYISADLLETYFDVIEKYESEDTFHQTSKDIEGLKNTRQIYVEFIY